MMYSLMTFFFSQMYLFAISVVFVKFRVQEAGLCIRFTAVTP